MTLPEMLVVHRRERNAGIDVLRGISIALVVLHHIGIRIPLSKTDAALVAPRWILSAINYNGYDAVFMFFVISGFLITTNSISRWNLLSRINLAAFYRRRAARILPCLVLLLAVLAGLHSLGIRDYAIDGPNQSLPGATLSVIGLYLNWYEGQTGYLPANWDVLWSLSIEEVFYLGFPLLCIALRWDWLLLVLLGVLALSLPESRAALSGNAVWQEKAYLPGMAAIAMGVFCAIVATRCRPQSRLAIRGLFAVGISGVAADLFAGSLLWPILGNGLVLLLTFSTACLVLAFHWQAQEAQPWRLTYAAWLQSPGRLSYEIYLTHMFVVLPVAEFFRATGAHVNLGYWWYVPAVPLSWLLGWLVARWISIPAADAFRRRLRSHERTHEFAR